jgi:hypothetical protein
MIKRKIYYFHKAAEFSIVYLRMQRLIAEIGSIISNSTRFTLKVVKDVRMKIDAVAKLCHIFH